MTTEATLLVVDDTPQNIRLVEAVLLPRGYMVLPATSGEEALSLLEDKPVDLVLVDLHMPGMDGFEVCRRIRANEATAALPVVMMTASGDDEKVRALEAGADDFIPKPFNHAILLARIRSFVRLKRSYDTIHAQATELRTWAAELDQRVQTQVDELNSLGRLRRFLSPQVVDLVLSTGDDMLDTHRREIAALFCDLRGFTAFSEAAEPEDVMAALAAYHEVVGDLVTSSGATVGLLAGDGVFVYWNDPVPCHEPANRAVRFGIDLLQGMRPVRERWNKLGHELGIGVGIALGYATLGTVGFAQRMDYTAVGSTVNLASRLCADAGDGEILINQRAFAAVENNIATEPLGPATLKGFARPVPVYRIRQ